MLEWNGAGSFVNFKAKTPFMPNQPLESTLIFLNNGKELNRKLFVVKDAAGEFESGKMAALLKEIARKVRTGALDTSVVIVSPTLQIPKELETLITVMELSLPDEKEIYAIIKDFLEQNEIEGVYQGLLDEMSTAFKGLSELEIRDLLSRAVSSDGELTRKSLQLIFGQKQQMILKAGILEMVPLKESIDDIGGLENLKEWLRKKAAVFKDIRKATEFGDTMPKGGLIAGVPGCGKSLSAKAAGKLVDVPLLRLDMGRLMGKYMGESEENM